MRNLLCSRDSGPKHPDLSFRPSMAFTLRAQSVQIGSPADLSSHNHHYAPHKKAGCCLDTRKGAVAFMNNAG
jgi:hypothetical protein